MPITTHERERRERNARDSLVRRRSEHDVKQGKLPDTKKHDKWAEKIAQGEHNRERDGK